MKLPQISLGADLVTAPPLLDRPSAGDDIDVLCNREDPSNDLSTSILAATQTFPHPTSWACQNMFISLSFSASLRTLAAAPDSDIMRRISSWPVMAHAGYRSN